MSFDGALSFLNNGTPTPATSSYSQSSTQLPSWYTNYANSVVNSAGQFANSPYQIYQGPLVAGMTGNQNAGIDQIKQNSTAYNGYAPQGADMVKGALDPSKSGLSAANPYLTSGNTNIAGNIGNFQNPYVEKSNQNLATLAGQNFNENVLPGIRDSFTSAGQLAGPGSTRMGDEEQIAARNEEQGLQQAQTANELGAYNTSLSGATAQGNLTAGLGATAGNLASQGVNQGIQGGATTAGIGATGLNTANAGAGALFGAGTAQQTQNQNNLTTNAGQFYAQENAPITGLQIANSGINGLQIPSAVQNYSYGANPYAWGNSTPGLSAAGQLWETSDRRTKTDIARLGTSLAGLPVYEFRYKGDTKKRTGMMADEVERVFPDAVATAANGYKLVNYAKVA